jgi:hypothetical protein
LLNEAKLVVGVALGGRFADLAQRLQRLLVAGGGGRVAAGQPVQHAELVEDPGLPVAVAEVAAQRLGLVESGGSGRISAGQRLHVAQADEGIHLAVLVAQPAEEFQRLLSFLRRPGSHRSRAARGLGP